ncbi:hypothetical protein SEA_FAUST_158 [Streptomyces phage Faust]|uniref:Uncharacterized protein n=1 Tax=Streptomyces phage Faust TaxID=2767565 RepID=A0A7G9UYY2_9CAUD|nr:hypothetical protein PP456_gp122 [Streptomyces phage Faust]QNN99237.1 hypothetical protein SEA_FAUST_158 [Streptomyces phage Faust]
MPLFSVEIIPWGYCYDCYTKVEWDIQYSKPWCPVCEKRIPTHSWDMQKKFKEVVNRLPKFR